VSNKKQTVLHFITYVNTKGAKSMLHGRNGRKMFGSNGEFFLQRFWEKQASQ